MALEKEKEKYSKIILSSIQKPDFKEMFNVVKNFSHGKIWIVGGWLVGEIANEIYDFEIEASDIDFMTEEFSLRPLKQSGWYIFQTKFGDLRFVSSRGGKQIDLMCLQNFHPIIRRNLSARMAHFYTSVPP